MLKKVLFSIPICVGMILLMLLHPLYAEDDSLNLDFTNAPVPQILATIAELAGMNLVLDQSVTGTMSLHVNHMNWQQALNLVLSTEHLSLKTMGNTWFVSDNETMVNTLKTEGQLTSAMDQSLPLETVLLPLHYANGQNLIDVISHDKALLSARGQIAWDQRTNTLVVTDTDSHVADIHSVVNSLDVPVQQIHIEARIVVVDKSALQAFGVQLDNGATNAMNLLGSISSATLNLGIANPAGTIGFGLGTLAGNELDLQLQALETSGDGKVISAPELTVSDNQEADIQQGSEVPFQTSTSSGATQIEYIPATLGLKVTPELTQNGEINLVLQVNKNSVSNEVGPSGNMPIINTSQVNTNVLVHNGQTIVLGGIYSEEDVHANKQVPVLGGIPGIGWLFRNSQDSQKYTDLLIFVTPSVVANGDQND